MISHFQIINVTPLDNSSGVDINQIIEINFSDDIITKGISSKISLFRVLRDEFTTGEFDLNNLDTDFETIDCSILYVDRIIQLKPLMQLDKNTRFIVYVSDTIQNVIDDFLPTEHVSIFTTSYDHKFKEVTVISPEFGEVIKGDDIVVKFDSSNFNDIPVGFKIEIASDKYFNDTLVEEYTENGYTDINEYKLDGTLREGSYYLRIQAIDGLFSKTIQFFFKPNVEVGVHLGIEDEEDIIEAINEDREFELLETFPDDNAYNVNEYLNVIFYKFKGKLTESDFDLNNTVVKGSYTIEEDVYNEHASEQGDVNGEWNIVYDDKYDVTYLIFKLDELIEEIDE